MPTPSGSIAARTVQKTSSSRDERERERDEFGALEVALEDRVEVVVDREVPGGLDREDVGCDVVPELRVVLPRGDRIVFHADDRDEVMPVPRYEVGSLRRRVVRGEDRQHARVGAGRYQRLVDRGLVRGVGDLERLAPEDEGERRSARPWQLGLDELRGPAGFRGLDDPAALQIAA